MFRSRPWTTIPTKDAGHPLLLHRPRRDRFRLRRGCVPNWANGQRFNDSFYVVRKSFKFMPSQEQINEAMKYLRNAEVAIRACQTGHARIDAGFYGDGPKKI